ncbi:MAG: hypothetical protein HWN80_18110 [Candidatus Lokiarchaeota archaeon]|nr:hypothetical protein [Candidatus Lokiarchaeota archaeon]
MSSNLKGFRVACPKCGTEKQINVPESLFYQKKFGTVKIKIPQGAVCKDHHFIVFISTKGQIVGYDVIDTSVSSDQGANVSKEIIDLTLDELIDAFGFNCVAGLIHAKLFDYSSFVVRSEEFNINIEQLDEMFDRLIPLQYRNNNAIKDVEFDTYVFTNEDYFYTAFKNNNTDSFLINNRKHIIHKPWESACEFEKSILENALGRNDKGEQLKYLAQYILRFIKDVEFTKTLLENSKSISEKDLIKQLKEKLIVSTINKKRVLFIKEFIKQRFSNELSAKIKG